MNIVCVKQCFNRFNQPFKLGKIYRYDWEDRFEGVSDTYYAIYEHDESTRFPFCMGYINTEFLENNFLSFGEYKKENEYVRMMFEFFMDYSHINLDVDVLKLAKGGLIV